MRQGRLSSAERLEILGEIGLLAQEKYNDIVANAPFRYNLKILKDGLQFRPDVQNFKNDYWVDYNDDFLNRVAYYFEHGTGIRNMKTKTLAKSDRYITPVIKRVMKFTHSKSGGTVFASKVKGVRPVFMFDRTKNFLKENDAAIKTKFRIDLDI